MIPSQQFDTIKRLSASGALPALPLISGPTAEGSPMVHADLVVDLAQVLTRAKAAGVVSLDIYADTLTIPPGFAERITAPMIRLSILARRVVTGEGTATLTLDHAQEKAQAIRICVGSVEGNLSILSTAKPGPAQAYDAAAWRAKFDKPSFALLGLRNGEMAAGSTVVPVGLLALGEPLHRTLSASFDFAAAMLASPMPDAEMLGLCHAILPWISGWSGLQSDLAQIAQLADALRLLAPRMANGVLVLPIPPLRADSYLKLAEVRMNLAKSIDLDAKMLEQNVSAAQIATAFASASAKREAADQVAVFSQMDQINQRSKALDRSVRLAADAMLKEAFEQKLAQIHMDLASELDRIDRITKATFDIAMGIVGFLGGIAAIYSGVPGDPKASAQKDVQGLQSLANVIKDSQVPLRDSGALKNIANLSIMVDNIGRLYRLPFAYAYDNRKSLKDPLAAIGGGGAKIFQACSAIRSGNLSKEDLDKIGEDIGAAMRELNDLPPPAEAKAAWDALEAEAVNRLDVVINDNTINADIRTAATEFKTSVQKTAIYGRLMSEYQAAKDAADRELAGIALQQTAVIEKVRIFEDLKNGMGAEMDVKERLTRDVEQRVADAGRAFFVACLGMRQAQFYESEAYPRTLPRIARTAREMESTYAELVSDRQDVVGADLKFSRDLIFKEPGMLGRLASGQVVTLSIDVNRPELARLSRIRLNKIQAWVESATPVSGLVRIELTGGASFTDRGTRGVQSYVGQEQSIPFEYEGAVPKLERQITAVQPTPFATWLVRLDSPASIASPSALRMTIEGTSA